MKINTKGFWENVDCGHVSDEKLIPSLIHFLKKENASTVVDLGCGNGYYVKEMRKEGINADGFDGNPNTPLITDNVCGILDLSVPKKLDNDYDWVVSFEVGEHLPKEYEDSFIKNLDLNNKKGIVLSWAIKGQGGTGHYNEQNNDYVKQKLCNLGYLNDLKSELILRQNSSLPWFKNTIMVFKRE